MEWQKTRRVSLSLTAPVITPPEAVDPQASLGPPREAVGLFSTLLGPPREAVGPFPTLLGPPREAVEPQASSPCSLSERESVVEPSLLSAGGRRRWLRLATGKLVCSERRPSRKVFRSPTALLVQRV